eukprot:g10490.t1
MPIELNRLDIFFNSKQLFPFKYLQRLIPQSWGKLMNLKYIYFNNEGISGDLSVLSNMNKLVEVRFSDNPLLSGPLSFIKSSRIVRGTFRGTNVTGPMFHLNKDVFCQLNLPANKKNINNMSIFESRWGFQCQEETRKAPPCQFAILDSNGLNKRFICNNQNETKNREGAYPISCFYLNRSDSQGAYVCSKVGETDPDCFCENIHYTMGTMK